MELLSSEEVRSLDKQVLGSGVALDDLINAVGKALFQSLERLIEPKQKILGLLGPGHNGDDAAVVCRLLAENNFGVDLFEAGETKRSATEWPPGIVVVDSLDGRNFHEYDWVIDGLYGTGLCRPLPSELVEWLDKINGASCGRVAIDIPTGVQCDSGDIYPGAFMADVTLTVAAPKRGLYLLPGRGFCGDIQVVDVPSLQNFIKRENIATQALPSYDFSVLSPTMTDSKYSRGKVAVVLSEDFPGAGLMVALAAQGAGAGYVKVHCPQSLLKECQIRYPHLVFSPYDSRSSLLGLLENEKAQSLVLGSGWHQESIDFSFPLNEDTHYIFDGGCLQDEFLLSEELRDRSNFVITPHWGELKRLSFLDGENKWEKTQSFISQSAGLVVAKGYDTLIAQQKHTTLLATWNSPTLATAGSGDILCGIIAAFSARDRDARLASAMAVDVHRKLAQNHPVTISPTTMIARLAEVLNGLE